MHKKFLPLTVLAIYALLAFPVRGQETSSVDKLQSTARTETTGSLQSFLHDIWELDPKIQDRLLRARLTNATLNFSDRTQLKSDAGTGYDSRMSVDPGRKSWTISSFAKRCLSKSCGVIRWLWLKVEIKPNPEMLEWMRARDEYIEYSRDRIPDHKIHVFDFSGKIEDAALTKRLTRDEEEICVLELSLGSVSTSKLAIATHDDYVREGTVRGHINLLKEKTADWVKHYMGKGSKPEPIF